VLLSRALPALLLVLALPLVGCFNATAKKIIVGANEVQDGAKNAYNDAKAQAETAGKACGEVARTAVPPVVPSLEACAALGIPIPYDPEKLNKLAGPINAAYEAIRGAEAARLAWRNGNGDKANVIVQVTLALEAITRFVAAANDAGLQIDTTTLGQIVAKWEGVK
jgi:hypothetical protein